MKTRWQTAPAIFIPSICQNAVCFSSVCKPSRLQRQKTKQQMEKEASIALMPLMGVGRTVDHHLRLISTEREWGKWTKNAIIQRGLNERVRVPKNAFHCWLACTVLSLCSAAWEDEIFPGPLRESLFLRSSKRTFKHPEPRTLKIRTLIQVTFQLSSAYSALKQHFDDLLYFTRTKNLFSSAPIKTDPVCSNFTSSLKSIFTGSTSIDGWRKFASSAKSLFCTGRKNIGKAKIGLVDIVKPPKNLIRLALLSSLAVYK